MWQTVRAEELVEGDCIYHDHALAFVKEAKRDGGTVQVVLDRSTHSAEFKKMMRVEIEELETVDFVYDDSVQKYMVDGEQLPWRDGASDETNNKAHKGETIEVDVKKIMKEMLKQAKKAMGLKGRKRK